MTASNVYATSFLHFKLRRHRPIGLPQLESRPGVNAPSLAQASPASRGYKPGFKTSLLAKDLQLAVEAGKEVGLQMATAELAHTLFADHAKAGGAGLDVTSLVLGLGGSEHLDELVAAAKRDRSSVFISAPVRIESVEVQTGKTDYWLTEGTSCLLSRPQPYRSPRERLFEELGD